MANSHIAEALEHEGGCRHVKGATPIGNRCLHQQDCQDVCDAVVAANASICNMSNANCCGPSALGSTVWRPVVWGLAAGCNVPCSYTAAATAARHRTTLLPSHVCIPVAPDACCWACADSIRMHAWKISTSQVLHYNLLLLSRYLFAEHYCAPGEPGKTCQVQHAGLTS